MYYTKLPDHSIIIQVKGVTHMIPTTHVNYRNLLWLLCSLDNHTEDDILPFLADIPGTKYVVTCSSQEFLITQYTADLIKVVFRTEKVSLNDQERRARAEILGVFASFEEAAIEFCEYFV